MSSNDKYASSLKDLMFNRPEHNKPMPPSLKDLLRNEPEKNDERMFERGLPFTEVEKNDERLSNSALFYREPEKNHEDMISRGLPFTEVEKNKSVVKTAVTDNVPPARDLPRMTAEVLVSQIDTYERMRFDDFSIYICLTPINCYWAKVMFDGDRPLSYEIYDTLEEAHPAGYDHEASARAEAIDGELMTDI
jgi:hypothetical protein